jgi:hypothetical protein
MTQAQELEHDIRGLINAPRKHTLLLADRVAWAKLCSSLDVIGDTELALEAYMRRTAGPQDTGELYLLMYGVLQVLYVQQDAVRHLAEALGVPYTRSTALSAVRNTRNDATGHPTSSSYGKAFNFISRITMFAGGFQMLTMKKDGTNETRQVNVPALIDQQRNEVGAALDMIAGKLREEETEHRRKFRGVLLASYFDQLDYFSGKLSEALFAGQTKMASGMLELLTKKMEALRAELEQRGLLGKYVSTREFIVAIEHPVGRLREYLAGSLPGWTPEDADVFRSFLWSKIEELAGIAAEIDAEYSKDA